MPAAQEVASLPLALPGVLPDVARALLAGVARKLGEGTVRGRVPKRATH